MTGLVLGSGLDDLVERVEVRDTVSFSDAGLPVSTVPGHQGCFVMGKLGGTDIIVMRGRVHLYEGHSAQAVTAGVRWMADQGVESLVLTNAAGSLREDLQPGSWMLLSDHLNLTGVSPLEGGPHFIDMTDAYDPEWREEFVGICRTRGVALGEGVYAGLRGPQYETAAEIRMLRAMGADAVGMSTVLETIQARALGLRVLGLSCLTNFGAGMPGAELDHTEVVSTAGKASEAMIDALEAWSLKD